MKEIKLDILAHADFSGRLRKSKRCPGFAVFATEIDAIRRSNPLGTILLDAGDEFSASFWPGEPMVKAVAFSGTDAMTLGNHEFDRGEDFLGECIAKAPFPVLCANIHRKDTGGLVPGTVPWVLLERFGVRIGILGLTTEYTPYMVTKSAFEPFEARSCAEAARRYIPEMRAAGAEILIVLAHIPFYIGEDGISGELADLLADIPPVDVCIGGHIPGDYAGLVGDTVVLKGGFSGVSLCRAELYFDVGTRRIARREFGVRLIDWETEPRSEFRKYEEAVTAPFADFFDKALTTTGERWRIALARESNLGNYFAQCVQEEAGTDFAYMNATSAGGEIGPGTVTAEDITATMGFNDPVLVSEMTGNQIYELFELVYVPERFGNNAGLMFSGLIVRVDHRRPAMSKILEITLRDGTPIDREARYSVATSEYMASGGNDTSAVASRLRWKPAGLRVYDAIFASLDRHGRMVVSPERRLREIGSPENDNAPF